MPEDKDEAVKLLLAEMLESIKDWGAYAPDFAREKYGFGEEVEGYRCRIDDLFPEPVETQILTKVSER